MKVVPLGDTCKGSVYSGACRLVARVPCQMVWKHISPGGSKAASRDNAEVEALLALDVPDLQCFGDTLKVNLLVFLELWLRMYPLSCGSG